MSSFSASKQFYKDNKLHFQQFDVGFTPISKGVLEKSLLFVTHTQLMSRLRDHHACITKNSVFLGIKQTVPHLLTNVKVN